MTAAEEGNFLFQVTFDQEAGWNLTFGRGMEEIPYDDNTKLHMVGKMLADFSTRLLTSEITDDDNDYDYEEDDD